MNLPKGRRAFFVMESQTNDDGEYRACIAVEHVRGYFKTDWCWGKNLKVATGIARRRNELIELTPADALKIICFSMQKDVM